MFPGYGAVEDHVGLDTQQLLTSVGLVVAAAFLLLEALQLIQEAPPRGDDAPPVVPARRQRQQARYPRGLGVQVQLGRER